MNIILKCAIIKAHEESTKSTQKWNSQNQTGQAGIRELKTDTELELELELEMEGKHEVH